jgi:lycopene epsilon-cyclase
MAGMAGLVRSMVALVQASFHIFGMELLATLDVQYIHEFFRTFFRLPDSYWRGFLASKLSSVDLMKHALLTFVFCTPGMRTRLIKHLLTHPSGRYLVRTYTAEIRSVFSGADKESTG